MHYAADGAATTCAWLLSRGAAVDACNAKGMTALMMALDNHHFDVAWNLLNAGADPRRRDANGQIALHYAGACATDASLLSRLARRPLGVDVRNNHGQTALMLYARDNHATPCGWLIELGADINARSRKGMTALLFAARNGRAALVATLLEAGADPALGTNDGYDLAAACASDVEVAQVVAAWRARTAMGRVLASAAPGP